MLYSESRKILTAYKLGANTQTTTIVICTFDKQLNFVSFGPRFKHFVPQPQRNLLKGTFQILKTIPHCTTCWRKFLEVFEPNCSYEFFVIETEEIIPLDTKSIELQVLSKHLPVDVSKSPKIINGIGNYNSWKCFTRKSRRSTTSPEMNNVPVELFLHMCRLNDAKLRRPGIRPRPGEIIQLTGHFHQTSGKKTNIGVCPYYKVLENQNQHRFFLNKYLGF